MKIIDNILSLRKYFQLASLYTKIPKAELLSSNQALKDFGKLWKDNKGDVMIMNAVIEYEYGRNKNYSEIEIAIVKKTLAEVTKFLKDCTTEWKEFEEAQARKTHQ